MPIYNFVCKHCNHETEMFKKMDEKAPNCQSCGRSMVRAMASITFILKGSRWSCDNYGLKEKKKGGSK